MVSVALIAVDGAGMSPTRCASGLGSPPGHWRPARCIEISSTVRPSAHPAVWLVTSPADVELGCPQPSIPRHVALTASTDGPSTRASPSADNACLGRRCRGLGRRWCRVSAAPMSAGLPSSRRAVCRLQRRSPRMCLSDNPSGAPSSLRSTCRSHICAPGRSAYRARWRRVRRSGSLRTSANR